MVEVLTPEDENRSFTFEMGKDGNVQVKDIGGNVLHIRGYHYDPNWPDYSKTKNPLFNPINDVSLAEAIARMRIKGIDVTPQNILLVPGNKGALNSAIVIGPGKLPT